MLVIENFDTLLQGIEKIKENIELIKKLSNSLSLSDEEKTLLNNNIIYFLKNLNGIENLSKSYNSFDNKEQHWLVDLTLDLYNNINQIMINSDCFEYFDKIPSNSVDLILTDPPYNSTHNDFDKNEVDLDYLWYNYIRVLKPSGIIIMFADNLFMAKLIMSNVSWFKYTLVWEKNKFSDFMNAKKKPLKIHENICVFYNKTPITYNIQYFYGEPYKRSNKQETIDKK